MLQIPYVGSSLTDINDATTVSAIMRISNFWIPESRRNVKIFTEGMSNRLYGVYDASCPNEMLLFRVFGNNTDVIIDRLFEYEAVSILSQHKFAEAFLSRFDNGVTFRYIAGECLKLNQISDSTIYPLIAAKLAEMHSLQISPSTVLPAPKSEYGSSIDRIDQWLESITSDEGGTCSGSVLAKLQIKNEREFIVTLLDGLKVRSPLVLCHNDLLPGNIILNECSRKINFIDFEYAGFNPISGDIGNHFSEFIGLGQGNPDLYPKPEFRKKWIETYLNALDGLENEDLKLACSKLTIDDWLRECHIYSMISDLLWATWNYVQESISQLDCDYIGQAESHMATYWIKKNSL